jgi:Holliday junction resolvase RusA-like endonuclease
LRNVYRLVIPGTLPNLNDYIGACRRNKFAGAKMKNQAEHLISIYIKAQLKHVKFKNAVILHFTWIEPNKRRDLDNIAGMGHKIILDSLVNCGVLVDDGWRYVAGFTDNFEVDKKTPRIEVHFEEVE